MLTRTATDSCFGPARVTDLAPDGCPIVETTIGTRPARLALPVPYQPAIGDELLVAGEGDQLFVIGVIKGQGRTAISTHGDLELEATGRVIVRAGESVDIEAPRVGVRTDRFELFARDVFERLMNAYRWVKGVCQLRAGRSRRIVQGTDWSRAGRIDQRAEGNVTIDGKQIHIG